MKEIKMKKILSQLMLLGILSSCAHVHSVSLTPIPKNRGKTVRAETSKTIILAFNFNNDYVDTLTAKLESQCPGGKVTGILTKDQSTNYFFFHKRQVVATGYCVK